MRLKNYMKINIIQPGKPRLLNIFALLTAILFFFGCASGRQHIGDGILTSTPEKLKCVDVVLKGEKRFNGLTLRENILSERYAWVGGIYDYLYSFVLKDSLSSRIYIRYPLLFGKPEVFVYFTNTSGPRSSKSKGLNEILGDTIKNIKDSCPDYYVHGDIGLCLVDD